MSWLGKILVFFVLIGAVVWASYTVNVYVTRTNWKTEAERYKKAYNEAIAAREKDHIAAQADKEAYVRLYLAEKSRGEDLSVGIEKLIATGRTDDEKYQKLLKDYNEADVQNRKLDNNLKATLNELDNTRKRSNLLEDKRVELVLAKEFADRERLRAENDAKLARAIADDNAQRVEQLTALVNELKASGGGGTATVLRSINKPPAPLPDNIRGTVLYDMREGNLVQISIGIDAGLEPGSQLDVYRDSNGGKYLGTLTVTTTLKPKEAVAEFRPARGVPISQLRLDEIPRKNDIVGKLR